MATHVEHVTVTVTRTIMAMNESGTLSKQVVGTRTADVTITVPDSFWLMIAKRAAMNRGRRAKYQDITARVRNMIDKDF